MPLLIDGHNLIGQMTTISLGDEDDEAQLVRLLRLYLSRRNGGRIIVIFDRGVRGHPAPLDSYGIECEFVLAPGNADMVLIKRINEVRNPGSWQVVTSDREIALAARRRNIRVIPADEFAGRLESMLAKDVEPPDPNAKPRLTVTEAEVQEWLELFGIDPADADRVDLPLPPPKPPTRRKRRRR